MTKSRIEAFSDGVLAIVLTIMVLEIKLPHGADLEALCALAPPLLGYVLSFAYVGIYWSNHHHLLHATRTITGGVLLANLHLLFWISLVPIATAWVGEHPWAPLPTAIYGVVLLLSGLSWLLLTRVIIRANGPDSELAKAIGNDPKGNASAVLYMSGIGVSFVRPILAQAIYAFVALMWLVPDRRIERQLATPKDHP
jgi:uncharacterized membrane protein